MNTYATAQPKKTAASASLPTPGLLLQRKSVKEGAVGEIPPIVHEVLQSPGQPLDGVTRAFFEPRFGQDFSQVRVHTDARAGESAQAVNALAYTVGKDVVFGTDQFKPNTPEGRLLLGHELTHSVQQTCNTEKSPSRLGPVHDAYEQEAERQSARIARGEPTTEIHIDSAGTGLSSGFIQRTLFGGILGGISGAAGGALIGGLLGGPIGAVIGGIAGLVGGALIGEKASTDGRSLTPLEISYAKEIFKESIDYSTIRVTRDSMYTVGAPLTIGNTIHLKSSWGHFKGDTLELTPSGIETLIHEMGHVWQYQNGGLAYIPESLWVQFKAFVSGGDRGGAYEWREAHKAGLPWEDWNPEQQAQSIEDYNKLLRKSKDGTATLTELSELSTLLPYMQKVWKRQGAPQFETANMAPGDYPI